MHNEADRESAVRKVRLADLYPVISETLDAGGEVRLPVTGTSMYPTILGGRDQVTLVRPTEPLKKYDLPLYRRANGQFVLHRIISVQKDGTFTCCGDHQWKKEKGLRADQMLALTTQLTRKGKTFSAAHPRYVRWIRFWVLIRPLRAVYYTVAGFLSGIKHRILRKQRS